MQQSTIPSAQLLVQLCKKYEIQNIVISPGSRNAPLTLSFADHPYFKCFSIVDERCAAFFALGMAQQLQQPTAIICTSGSALLNYYPAIAEAFYSNIPLIVISADRPSYKIDIGDGQTIRQHKVFHNHIVAEESLLQDVSHATEKIAKYAPELLNNHAVEIKQQRVQEHNHDAITETILAAKNKCGPVHINIPFEEPLYNLTTDVLELKPLKAETVVENYNIDYDVLRKSWNSANRKMVLVGVHTPNAVDQAYIDFLANDPSVVFFTETTSNIYHNNIFGSIDSIIAPIEKSEKKEDLFKQLQPDILITFGGLVVSKKIKAFLRNYQPKEHWNIGTENANDTYFSLTHVHKLNVNSFFKIFLNGVVSVPSNYFSFWKKRKEIYLEKRNVYVNKIPFSDFKAYAAICNSVPDGYQIQFSNSSAIRYSQLFDNNKNTTVFCNRGTSGIDGSVSTAIGAAYVNKSPTVMITGDLSFLYDKNGLWNNYIPNNFKIIVINNSGGGIFRILPGFKETENFKTFFETTHNIDISAVCKLYNINFLSAENETDLNDKLALLYEKNDNPILLEVKTSRMINNEILLTYFDFIS